MSAPPWLRRPPQAPAPNASPAPFLPVANPASATVRPLFAAPTAARRPPSSPSTHASRAGAKRPATDPGGERRAEAGHEPPAATVSAAHADALKRLGEALRSLEALEQRVLEQARADAVDLALAMVKNLVGNADGVSVDKLLEVAREALSAAGPTKTAVLRVHPDDLALMQAAALHSGEGAPVELRADAGLGKGDIVVDTPAGRVDGTRRARLDRLERSVRRSMDAGELDHGRHDPGGER